jgi:hypothetical protein
MRTNRRWAISKARWRGCSILAACAVQRRHSLINHWRRRVPSTMTLHPACLLAAFRHALSALRATLWSQQLRARPLSSLATLTTRRQRRHWDTARPNDSLRNADCSRNRHAACERARALNAFQRVHALPTARTSASAMIRSTHALRDRHAIVLVRHARSALAQVLRAQNSSALVCMPRRTAQPRQADRTRASVLFAHHANARRAAERLATIVAHTAFQLAKQREALAIFHLETAAWSADRRCNRRAAKLRSRRRAALAALAARAAWSSATR